MWIEFFGLICCGWTIFEVTRLVAKGLRRSRPRRQRYAEPSTRGFGAWDGSGAAIDVEIVD